MLYFAYGSNLDKQQMKIRCPAAIPLGKFSINDARLIFRGVADCIFEADAVCPGGLWEITPECEAALDIYEGVASGLYRKTFIPLDPASGDETPLLIYQMNSVGIYPPSKNYLATIRRGYDDFGLPVKALKAAVTASWDDKKPSHLERQRTRRTGRPILAARTGSAALTLPKRPGLPATGKHAGNKETT